MLKKDYNPTGIRIGLDALTLARNSYDKSFKGWEVNTDVDFNRYFFTVDFGSSGRTLAGDGEKYSNSGTYFRAGVDVNFLTKDPEKNMFFIGARYGRATFSENLDINRVDSVWGPINSSLANSSINGGWFELTTGIRVKMWKMIWMGYTARYKFGLSTNETGSMKPADVPGFGNTNKEAIWGFNYQILIRIPFRKSGPTTTISNKK